MVTTHLWLGEPRTHHDRAMAQSSKHSLCFSGMPGGASSLDIWIGSLVVTYAPKVATGLSPGFQPSK
jgi:hypothetical protein